MTLQFKIQLCHLKNPTVWRRVLVPDGFTFDDFHSVIQISFGWGFSHLYQFSPRVYAGNPVITLRDKSMEKPDLDASITKLKNIFTTEKQTFTYIYDFGDDWIHTITLEKILTEKINTPKCIKGQGQCPPEDCGGVWGYENILAILANPKHAEYKETKEWLFMDEDEEWDVNEFDIDDVNVMLEEEFE